MKTCKKTTFYILPGFGESVSLPHYQKIAQFVKLLGFKPKLVKIHWDNNKTISEYKGEILKEIKDDCTETSIAFGFSFGAYILALMSKEIKFKKIYFASLAPYFKDDIKNLPKEAVDYFGDRFIKDASKNVFQNNTSISAHFFVGALEPKFSIERTVKSYKKWTNKKKRLTIIKNASHFLDKKYLEALFEEIKKLTIL